MLFEEIRGIIEDHRKSKDNEGGVGDGGSEDDRERRSKRERHSASEGVSGFRGGKIIPEERDDARKKSGIKSDIKIFSDISNVPLNLPSFPASFEYLLDSLLLMLLLFSGREGVSGFCEGKIISEEGHKGVQKKSSIKTDIKTIF